MVWMNRIRDARVRVISAAVLLAAGGVLLGLAGCEGTTQSSGQGAELAPGRAANSKAEVGLDVGARVPEAELRTAGDKPVMLSSLYKDGPLVLVFIRGGWCPYCTGSLAGWDKKLEGLKEAGASLVVITPEKPDRHEAMLQKHSLHMRVLSDAKLDAARGFGLLYTLDEATRKKYGGYGVDLPSRNVTGTWELPHPATYVIDRDGTIRYAFARKDYTVRAEPAEVVGAVQMVK